VILSSRSIYNFPLSLRHTWGGTCASPGHPLGFRISDSDVPPREDSDHLTVVLRSAHFLTPPQNSSTTFLVAGHGLACDWSVLGVAGSVRDEGSWFCILPAACTSLHPNRPSHPATLKFLVKFSRERCHCCKSTGVGHRGTQGPPRTAASSIPQSCASCNRLVEPCTTAG
jgi:hypothetical protein